MLAFLNLGLTEMLLILVVAILVFGRNLPGVAVQAAATVQKMRRSLVDLRREAGIDDELRRARREFEQAVPRDLPRLVERKLDSITAEPEPRRGPGAARPPAQTETTSGDDAAGGDDAGRADDAGRVVGPDRGPDEGPARSSQGAHAPRS
jgi:Sec-independent protein translocase protein TatA